MSTTTMPWKQKCNTNKSVDKEQKVLQFFFIEDSEIENYRADLSPKNRGQ